MSTFGSPQERLAAVLHEARMAECYGNWTLPSRFKWPETREAWEHFHHHPHPAIGQAMAQAKAALAHCDRDASLAEDAKRLSPEGVAARAEGIAQNEGNPHG